ncbi:hypothetical protein ACFLRB_00710 [Acidobacteriota bacterium]
MSRLKDENVKKCYSLLQEFIEEAPSMSSKKGLATLALSQLQKITAGTGTSEEGGTTPHCHDVPRIDGNPVRSA